MIGTIIVLLIVGLIAGFVARAIVPGRDPMGIVGTIVLGIAGSFLGGFLARALFNKQETTAGIIGSIIGAVILLLIYNVVTKRSRSSAY